VLTIGLANAPSQFMQDMTCLLASNPEQHNYVAIYHDNVLIHTSIRDEHMDQWRIVLEQFTESSPEIEKVKI
jgi:hypothetical protein